MKQEADLLDEILSGLRNQTSEESTNPVKQCSGVLTFDGVCPPPPPLPLSFLTRLMGRLPFGQRISCQRSVTHHHRRRHHLSLSLPSLLLLFQLIESIFIIIGFALGSVKEEGRKGTSFWNWAAAGVCFSEKDRVVIARATSRNM